MPFIRESETGILANNPHRFLKRKSSPVCGGAGALAYILTEYNGGSYLDKVVLTSGPVFSDIEQGCMVPNAPPVTICPPGEFGCVGDAMKILLTAVFLVLISGALSFAQDADAARKLAYDQKAPLEIKEIGVEQRGDVAVHDISYASPKGGRVPAYLVVPAGKGPFAAVIWGHWYWDNSAMRNRKEFLDEAVVLARSGVVSLLTDGPVARPGHVEDQTPLNEQQVTDLVQQIVDMRRGADLLLARADVDPRRLAYVGHSYNASVGGFLAGIDKRFKAFVLMAGGLSDELDLKSKEMQEHRQKVGAEKFDAFIARYSWLDPGKFVSHAAPATVFLQYATQERFLTAERARQYEAIVSDPKRFKLYEAPHALNAEARRDRIAFLVEQLQLKPPGAKAVAKIPDLVQPPEPNP